MRVKTTNNAGTLKCGEYINWKGVTYLFLGYCDYKRLTGKLADRHGNTTVILMTQLHN